MLCLLFSVLYTLSFVISLLASMPWLLHCFIAVFLAVHLIYTLRRFVFYRHPLSIQRLWYDGRDVWKVQCRNTQIYTVNLMQSVVLSHYLVLLSFKVPGRFFPLALPLARDSDAPEMIRKLRYVLLSL